MALKSFKTYLGEENLDEAFPLLAAIPALLGKLGAMGGAALATKTGGAIAANVASTAASSLADRLMTPRQTQASAGADQEAPSMRNIRGGRSVQVGSPTISQTQSGRTDANPVGSTNRTPLASSPSDMAIRGFAQLPGRNISRPTGMGY
jgi:hypothetical protein